MDKQKPLRQAPSAPNPYRDHSVAHCGPAVRTLGSSAEEAERIRALALEVAGLAALGGTDQERLDALRLAYEIDDDDPRVAIKAHQALVEWVADSVLAGGIVYFEVAPLVNALHNFIGLFDGYFLYSYGEWRSSTMAEPARNATREFLEGLRRRRSPWKYEPGEQSASNAGDRS